MARSSEHTYDPKTGKWTTTTVSTKDKDVKKPVANKDSEDSSNLTSSTSDNKSATGSAEKKYNTIEYNTLNGTLNFIATTETIKIQVGDTITLDGLGKYLSGNYYVQEVSRSLSSSGYSHNCTLVKTDFGKSLKSKESKGASKSTTKTVTSSTPTNKRKYIVKKGDTLMSISKKFFGNGGHTSRIIDAKTQQKATANLKVGQTLIII